MAARLGRSPPGRLTVTGRLRPTVPIRLRFCRLRRLRVFRSSCQSARADARVAVHVLSRRGGGWSLARAHARSGDRLAIAAYLGAGSKFDDAIARFSTAYADQNELDHSRLAEAVAAGEVPARTGV